jgi:hypothetical protein
MGWDCKVGCWGEEKGWDRQGSTTTINKQVGKYTGCDIKFLCNDIEKKKREAGANIDDQSFWRMCAKQNIWSGREGAPWWPISLVLAGRKRRDQLK